jgi:hypothetical protein
MKMALVDEVYVLQSDLIVNVLATGTQPVSEHERNRPEAER